MATRVYIPLEVVGDIKDWVRQAELAAIADFPQTSRDEDAIVESFGTRLRCRSRVVEVSSEQELPGAWKWSMSHTRFGSGRGAEEKYVGADVIIELVLRRANRYRAETKGFLLQAKKNWTTDAKILGQAAKLSNWREAAAVMNLTRKHFEAFQLDDVILGKGRRPSHGAVRLSDFLVNEFVAGELGDDSLIYDARGRYLQWIDMKNTLVKCSFCCKQRYRFTIDPPAPPDPYSTSALIDPNEIQDHRLKATPVEILGVPHAPKPSEIKKALRQLQKVYHPDSYNDAAEFVKQAVNRRSQEINYAVAELRRSR